MTRLSGAPKTGKTILLILAAALVLVAATTWAGRKPAAKSAARPAANTSTAANSTLENLQIAHSAGINAKARYELFALKAKQEGYLGIASLFKAVAVAESRRMARHAVVITSMGAVPRADVKTPREDLQAAMAGLDYERKTMYPEFLRKAQADRNTKALMSFRTAAAVAAFHARAFASALLGLEEWKSQRRFLVCQNCGYSTQDTNLKTCPVCSWPRSRFDTVE